MNQQRISNHETYHNLDESGKIEPSVPILQGEVEVCIEEFANLMNEVDNTNVPSRRSRAARGGQLHRLNK